MGDFKSVGEGLRSLREEAGLEVADLAEKLILGPGWVELVESDDYEPPTSLLATWLEALGTGLVPFLSRVELSDASTTGFVRGLLSVPQGDDLEVRFRFGKYAASYVLEGVSETEFDDFLSDFRNRLASETKTDAVAGSFLAAVRKWKKVNPSDVWYFLISQAYLDRFNHPATDALTDLGQSWKRTGGWALERVITMHYNDALRTHGIQLQIPDRNSLLELLAPLKLGADAKPEKADVIAVGGINSDKPRCFGVIHVKASFAERRNADLALSRALMARGFVSPFVTMDSKASPGTKPVNRGELGAPWSEKGDDLRGPKRREIELERNFDACFSFNANTIPTPEGQDAAARIVRLGFNEPNDAFVRHLANAWAHRSGDA